MAWREQWKAVGFPWSPRRCRQDRPGWPHALCCSLLVKEAVVQTSANGECIRACQQLQVNLTTTEVKGQATGRSAIQNPDTSLTTRSLHLKCHKQFHTDWLELLTTIQVNPIFFGVRCVCLVCALRVHCVCLVYLVCTLCVPHACIMWQAGLCWKGGNQLCHSHI